MSAPSTQRAGALSLGLVVWLTLGFLVLPSLVVIPMSFGGRGTLAFPPKEFSLDLYVDFFTQSEWVEAARLSALVALGSTALALLLAVPAAYGLVRSEFKGKAVITFFLMSPIVIPNVIIGLSLYIYFANLSFNQGFVRLVFGMAIVSAPFILITVMAGLRDLDPNLEIAATTMGASRLTVFKEVTVPLIGPHILSGALLAFLISFDEVVVAYFLSRVGYTTLSVKMFSSIQWELSPILAAVATMLIIIATALCIIVALFQKNR